ncbi:MAG: fasciclin domain-containing protein, partial [Casimicrobium sp.]
MYSRFLKYLLGAASLSFLAACGSDDHEPAATPTPTPPAPKTIVATAQGVADLSSLVAALQFASENNDLVNLLSNPGTFTVFAPSNAAFDKLAVTLTGNANAKAADILVPANKPLVRTVLQYHVLTSTVRAANIPFGRAITPAAGGIFKIDLVSNLPVITDGRNRKANITATDIEASNGVVHLIDQVLLPADKTIVDTAKISAPEFTSLVAALQFASENNDLVTLLSSAGPFTVFAPTNAAFDALAKELTGNANAVA